MGSRSSALKCLLRSGNQNFNNTIIKPFVGRTIERRSPFWEIFFFGEISNSESDEFDQNVFCFSTRLRFQSVRPQQIWFGLWAFEIVFGYRNYRYLIFSPLQQFFFSLPLFLFLFLTHNGFLWIPRRGSIVSSTHIYFELTHILAGQ